MESQTIIKRSSNVGLQTVSQYFNVHPTHPQLRHLRRAADIVRDGGVIVYPTDSTYALGCMVGDKAAAERVLAIRQLDDRHLMTLVCADLSKLSIYARVDNVSYRVLKHYTPGPFTFVLPASREVPRRLIHRKRRTIGLRVPACPIAQGILAQLGEPMLSTTLKLPGEDDALFDPEDIRDRLGKSVDLVVDGGPCSQALTTVVDLTQDVPVLTRQGLGAFES